MEDSEALVRAGIKLSDRAGCFLFWLREGSSHSILSKMSSLAQLAGRIRWESCSLLKLLWLILSLCWDISFKRENGALKIEFFNTPRPSYSEDMAQIQVCCYLEKHTTYSPQNLTDSGDGLGVR